jgi:alpha-L-fucosidase 2
MPVSKIFSAAAVILTALVLALLAIVATPTGPPLMSRLVLVQGPSDPGIPIDDPGAEPRAQSAAPCLPLIARNPDGNYIVPGVRGAIIYRRIGTGASGFGSGATELSLDAYVQPGGGGPRPGVIVLHGGGWERGSRAAFTGQFLEMLTRAGYNWVAIDYRFGTLADHARAVEDVQAALAFVRCHARELEIDPARLVLWGEDTGAQLAALVASRPSSGVRAMVLVGGHYDYDDPRAASSTPPAAESGKQSGTPPERSLASSPMRVVRRGMPSTLLVHGTADTDVPLTQPKRYCEQLAAAGAACEILEVDGASHRAENWWPSQWSYKPRIIAWLSGTLSFTAPLRATNAPAESPRIAPGIASGAASGLVTGLASGLHKDIIFSPAHGLKLDAYIPPVQRDGAGPFPAVIIAHGGGWEAGDKVTYVTPLFEPLAKAGFAWFSIDYRLTPDVLHPAQLDDLREAIRFVRANASRFNIDPNRIALLGESASGQMVMQVAAESASDPTGPTDAAGATNANSRPAVAAVVSFYGVYDFEPMVEAAPSPPRSLLWRLFRLPALDDQSRAVLRAYSPIHHVRRGMPPVLLIHGTNERLWAQGQSMSRTLTARGIPHELIPRECAPHGLENREGHARWMPYKSRLVTWLRDQLRVRD